VKEHIYGPRRCRLLAGGVVELWKAEVCFHLTLHLRRAAALAAF